MYICLLNIMKKISVITGNRSEYWLLSSLINLLNDSKLVDLSLYITGTHLSKKYGLTKNDIDLSNIKKVNYLDLKISKSNSSSIAKSMSIALLKFEKYFSREKPDLIILLGDRYESFITATAATLLNIPIAHFHGGEITEGVYDDCWRHCITKLSHIHFVSNKQYGKRVRQLGENNKYIKVVGAPGIDLLKNYQFLSKKLLSEKFKFSFFKKNILVVYHPNTLNQKSNFKEFENLLKAIYSFKDAGVFISFPGHDLGSDEIISLIKKYKNKYKKIPLFLKTSDHLIFCLWLK
jgi:GDP/UDP-N,N'-diacetylbacillosamine 2-epimerase (hydrolysing)